MPNSTKIKADPKPADDRRRCKKHPKHRQSPGVCSICLSERLSRLSSATSSRKTSGYFASFSSSSSLSSYYPSASSSSSCSSPIRYRYGVEKKAQKFSIFKKSRSLAFAPGIGDDRKIGGFWWKLIGRSKRKQVLEVEALTHSRTMVQRVHG